MQCFGEIRQSDDCLKRIIVDSLTPHIENIGSFFGAFLAGVVLLDNLLEVR